MNVDVFNQSQRIRRKRSSKFQSNTMAMAIVDGSVPGGSGQQGKQFTRSEGGEDIVFKHRDLFVIGMFESGYHPVLNIRYLYIEPVDR